MIETKTDRFKLVVVSVTLLFMLVLGGCGGGSGTSNDSSVVVFSDLHFMPFSPIADPVLFQKLVAADASEWAGIYQASSIKSPAPWKSDTNYPSLVLALASIKQNLGSGSVIIFTGDLLGHGIPQIFYTYINQTELPRGPADVAAMKAFTAKTLTFVMAQVKASVGNIPVVFALGNSDSYTGYGPTSPDSSFSTDSTFLPDTAELFYTKFLNGTSDHQEFLNTFKAGGYYSADLPGKNLTVIGLDTILFSTLFSPALPSDNDATVATQLKWFDAKLAAAKAAGKKVWLLMHVPPGADVGTTAGTVDASGHIASATMMWKPAYQAGFMQILSNYPGVISMTLGAHTHVDEYRLMSPNDVLEVTPSISPYFGNNPAFKIFTFSPDTYKPTGYSSMNYDLATMPGQFNNYYSFSTTYAMQGSLDLSLAQLFPSLAMTSAKQALYRGNYYSGNNSMNPITNVNWPVYWCGIGKMGQQEMLDCVNLY
jgi:3',5'-cyclic AMP phosphodiesterase CpdA